MGRKLKEGNIEMRLLTSVLALSGHRHRRMFLKTAETLKSLKYDERCMYP